MPQRQTELVERMFMFLVDVLFKANVASVVVCEPILAIVPDNESPGRGSDRSDPHDNRCIPLLRPATSCYDGDSFIANR